MTLNGETAKEDLGHDFKKQISFGLCLLHLQVTATKKHLFNSLFSRTTWVSQHLFIHSFK